MQPAFKNLPPEKRRRVLSAALAEFSVKDYKSANTDSIAASAGISKGLLFYYFKNKKTLYLTLVRYAVDLIEHEMRLSPAEPNTDLFDYLDALGRKKMQSLHRMPGLVSFSVRVFYDGGVQVSPVVNRYLLKMTDNLFEKYFANVDTRKFKPGKTPRQAIDWLIYIADGYIHTLTMAGTPLDLDALYENYTAWQEMVRGYMYKEEYL